MELGLTGKNALVCAGSKGLGLAIAKRLYAEGANLAICARDKETLKSAASEIANFAGRTTRPDIFAIDLSLPEGLPQFFAEVTAKSGGIDILVNNVGGPPASSAEMTSYDAWKAGFNQLFLSAVLLTQRVIPEMKQKMWGRVITVTSLSVLEPIDHLVVSTTMRTAVTAYMKTLSKEVAPFGITANTVLPGVIHTERIVNLRLAKANRDGTTLDDEIAITAKLIPTGRLGRPEELADLVAFLASTNASYITGANIPVDGGLRHSW
ncbi:MAG: SDR family oxidoreductase [Proteobacteria bacterium]|nr:SDR family oxidoreductase [Pseudomonadota bacterium]